MRFFKVRRRKSVGLRWNRESGRWSKEERKAVEEEESGSVHSFPGFDHCNWSYLGKDLSFGKSFSRCQAAGGKRERTKDAFKFLHSSSVFATSPPPSTYTPFRLLLHFADKKTRGKREGLMRKRSLFTIRLSSYTHTWAKMKTYIKNNRTEGRKL